MSDSTPSAPTLRDAATIILAREQNRQLEIYLLRRSTKSGFMGGLFVFPGGVVDAQDRGMSSWQDHIDLSPPRIEQELCDDRFDLESAVAFGVAAIRETLEEAGVMLASCHETDQMNYQHMAALRLENYLPEDWFRTAVQDRGWHLSFSNLGRWSHWITPERMKKRFDTRFFIAFMPENQTCVPDNLETKQGIWLAPRTALEQNLTAQTPLSPPTIVTLTQLSDFDSLSALKAHIRTRSWGSPIAPVLLPSDDGPVIIEPWDPEFAAPDQIRLKDLSKKVLEPGETFSRIWCDRGLWKPVNI